MAAENSKKEEVHKTLWAETADFRFEQRKEEWSIFTKLFNDNPKTAYEFLSSSGLGNEKEPSHLAIIFHNCSSLDKQLIGKELATKYDVLVSFLNYFAFAGMDLLSALREFLPMFQLPGEAQKIDIIFEVFSIFFFFLVILCFFAQQISFFCRPLQLATLHVIQISLAHLRRRRKMKKPHQTSLINWFTP